MGDISQHFSRKEFQCKCGCETERAVDAILLKELEMLRYTLNSQYKIDNNEWRIRILSGWRCPKHNKEVGGASHSKHLLGIATDIQVYNLKGGTIAPRLIYEILDSWHQNDCGLGLYENFVHFDVRKNKARW